MSENRSNRIVSINEALFNFLQANPDMFYDQGLVKCRFCMHESKYDSKQGVKNMRSHLSTPKHLEAKRLSILARYNLLNGKINCGDTHVLLLKALCSNNISFNATDSDAFKVLFERFGFQVRSLTYYRETILTKIADMKQ